MKIIAHRGWSSGKEENTLKAFHKSLSNGVGGVEIDIRKSICGKNIIISHDPAELEKSVTFEKGLEFISKNNLELLIEMKEFNEIFFDETIFLLEKYDLKNKSIIFAFRDIAKKFDWNNRNIKLGIISEYPWNIKKDIKKFNPDFILMGWDDRWWTKPTFKFIWSIFSLEKVCKKYNNVNFVVGVVNCKKDYDWLCKQNGLYCCTADEPLKW